MARIVDGLGSDDPAWRRKAGRAVALSVAIDAGLARCRLARPRALVSGFWRSGTTWLQETLADALRAKTAFEPLSPMEPRRRAMADATGDEDRLQAAIPPPGPSAGPLLALLREAGTGRRSSPFTLSCRKSAAEALRRGVVVKDVRLQANLPAAHAALGAPVIHLRRHPCGVVASLRAAAWHWSFARVSLPELAAGLGEGGEDLAGFDTDELARTAAFWALTERCAARGLAGQGWGRLVGYEAMLDDPAGTVTGLCRWLGREPRPGTDFGAPSATVHPDVFAAAGRPRDRWRTALSPAEGGRVEEIADALFPAWREPM